VRYRNLKKLTQPAVEPVSLAEAKHHCRVDTADDDGYISSLITVAREWCEDYCDATFLNTQYRMRLDAFPLHIELPRPPMSTSGTTTAVSIVYKLVDQSTVALDTTQYRVDRDSTPGVIRYNYSGSWPSHLFDFGAVEVTWWGGYGPDATSVSQRIKSAILWLVGMWYERRMAADQISLGEMPFGVKAMLDSVRWGSYA
jgi:uncharacterized phiE125 gp8 family phage protein